MPAEIRQKRKQIKEETDGQGFLANSGIQRQLELTGKNNRYEELESSAEGIPVAQVLEGARKSR